MTNFVIPSETAKSLGWDESEKYQWPGKEIHRFTTVTGKNVIQILLWDMERAGYVLKTWNEILLIRVQDSPEQLQTWFGLSRASFAVLPRVFMEAMPVEWQHKMGALLHEYSETIDTSAGDVHICEVVAKDKKGRYVSLPEDILNYRHPRSEFIASIKK